MRSVLVLVGFIFLAGCSSGPLAGQISGIVGNDLVRTSELAEKYGKPEVKQCADFLNTSLTSEDADLAKFQELLKEDTNGLLSAALKAALVAEMAKGFNDPAKQKAFEAAFSTNCGAVASQMVLTLARDARKVRQPGL